MGGRKKAGFLTAAAALAVLAAGAGVDGAAAATGAAPAGSTWARVTPAGAIGITAEIGLARGADSVLHVLWSKGSGPNSIMDTPITSAGAVKPAVTIAAKEAIGNYPAAAVTPSGIDVFWNAMPSSTNVNSEGMYEAHRPLKGGAWSKAVRVAATNAVEFVTDYAAADKSGHPWVAYTETDTLAVDPVGKPIQVIPPKSCCVYYPGLAADSSTGLHWVTYMSLITGHQGIFAQKLTGAGKASGAAIRLPGSATGGNVYPIEQQVATVSRGAVRAGVYAAYGQGYPSLTQVLVDRLGTAKPLKVAGVPSGIFAITAAADPAGRIWVAWLTSGGALYVSRSNVAVTAFGKPVRVAVPSGTMNTWKVYLNPTNSSADILLLTTNASNQTSYWSRVVPAP